MFNFRKFIFVVLSFIRGFIRRVFISFFKIFFSSNLGIIGMDGFGGIFLLYIVGGVDVVVMRFVVKYSLV